MKKNDKILSIFIDKADYEKGNIDITKMLYEIVPEEQIETIKYVIPSSTEKGIYYTIYIIEKKESSKNMGF